MASLNEKITALSERIDQERVDADAVKTSLNNLKEELERSELKLKEAEELNRTVNERSCVLQQNVESKSKENDHLRGMCYFLSLKSVPPGWLSAGQLDRLIQCNIPLFWSSIDSKF